MPILSTSHPPLALLGFEHVRRYWNSSLGSYAARILPGEFYVTRSNECIYTILGSCISACIRDRLLCVGGMNHFMLPAKNSCGAESAGLSASNRYGKYAMEHLVNEILKNGGQRQNLEVKLFGGGCITDGMADIGSRNINFVRDYLQTEGLQIVAEDVGETFPRTVIYFPATGKVRVKRLRSLHNSIISEEEIRYHDAVVLNPVGGDDQKRLRG